MRQLEAHAACILSTHVRDVLNYEIYEEYVVVLNFFWWCGGTCGGIEGAFSPCLATSSILITYPSKPPGKLLEGREDEIEKTLNFSHVFFYISKPSPLLCFARGTRNRRTPLLHDVLLTPSFSSPPLPAITPSPTISSSSSSSLSNSQCRSPMPTATKPAYGWKLTSLAVSFKGPRPPTSFPVLKSYTSAFPSPRFPVARNRPAGSKSMPSL